LTAVLTFLTVHCDLVAFHGPMLAGRLARGSEAYDRASLLTAVSRREPMGELSPEGLESLRPGEARGRLYGGTITQLLASFGTPFAFTPPGGSILFLEEVGERPYRLDRMITQLQQSGTLARAAGVVLGELPGCDEPGGQPSARAIMRELFADFPGPVVIGFPSGHTVRPAMTIPLGVECRVVSGVRSALVVEEGAVV
jgi:muramoyltetrapeptide carboxypeptidase